MFMIANKKSGTVAFATFWEAEDKGKYSKGRISTSEKDKDGNYVNSNWFANFVGEAHEKVGTLTAKDRITITSGKVSNTSSKDKDGNWQNYLNVTIFDFDKYEADNSPMNKAPEVADDDGTDLAGNKLPF